VEICIVTTLDALSEPLVRLFLRIDAAQPTDPLLRHAFDLWQSRRGDRIAPRESVMADLPGEISSHVFLVRAMTNGSRHWQVFNAGRTAGAVLKLAEGEAPEVSDRRIAVRLRRLFDLVADKAEPYSAMFETREPGGRRRLLVEVFAAPLSEGEKAVHLIFAALNSREESTR
jgi:hypothetical protein